MSVIVTEKKIIESAVVAEPFKDLFIAKLGEVELGYGVDGDCLILKYETTEGDRVIVNPTKGFRDNDIDQQSVYIGAVMSIHKSRRLAIGNETRIVSVIVNDPSSEIHATVANTGHVEYHFTKGVLFKKIGVAYVEADVVSVSNEINRFVSIGVPGLISDDIYLRVGGLDEYVQVKDCCRDPLVAVAFNPKTTVEQWNEYKRILQEAL